MYLGREVFSITNEIIIKYRQVVKKNIYHVLHYNNILRDMFSFECYILYELNWCSGTVYKLFNYNFPSPQA